MKRGLLVVAVALAASLLVGRAGTTGAEAASGVTVTAGPALQAPPPGVSPHADALAFFPRSVTVHVGQPVTWQFYGFHTVTFTGPHRPYPFVVPIGKQSVVKDASGHAMWWSGKAPVLGISPLALLPQGPSAIDSAGQTASSGLMRVIQATQKNPPVPYTLVFNTPGVYHYQCAVHPGMHGVVIVKAAGEGTPAAASEAAAAQTRLQQTISDLRSLGHTKPTKPDTVWVGFGHNSTGAEITQFAPSRISVAVGTTVRFVNHDQTDIHTVTFGPNKYTGAIEKGLISPHGKTLVLNGLGALASEPPGAPLTYDGRNHGNGYLNSGLLQPLDSPRAAGPHSFAVTFTRRGTYHYECVIHQNMDGTVVVH